MVILCLEDVKGMVTNMTFDLLLKRLRNTMPNLRLSTDEPMSRHTSFKIGGPVSAMALPSSAEELADVCAAAKECGVRPFIFGNGTNLLVQDEPLEMFAIKTAEGMTRVRFTESGGIYAESGALLSKVAVFAQRNGLKGIEFAHGIPGTIGGAVSMNAGAYGGEMKDAVVLTEYLDEELERRTAAGDEHAFAYRKSAFSENGRIILGSVLKLEAGDSEAIKARMNELSAKRRASQPLDMPSAGSTFKRPVGGYAAALIDESGLKGFSVGGAQVSEKHAGFIVNRGGATCADVLKLVEHIRETVFKNSGIMLETEIKYIHID